MSIVYAEWAPTVFDQKGMGLDDKQDWLVCLVLETRDSGCMEKSNFQACLEILGGESETVSVESWGHWGPGWVSAILVHPSRLKEVEDIESRLEDYSVLDDEDLSKREYDEMLESWDNWGCSDFEKQLIRTLEGMAEDLEGSESDIERELREMYESREFNPLDGMPYALTGKPIPTPAERLLARIAEIENWDSEKFTKLWREVDGEYEQHDDGCYFQIDDAVEKVIRDELFWGDPS